MFSGSNQTPSSRSSCDATASCRAEATSWVTYTASCYLAGSPGNCARWNACQPPDSIFILWASSRPREGGASAAFKRAHSNRNNTSRDLPSHPIGNIAGEQDRDGYRPLAARKGTLWHIDLRVISNVSLYLSWTRRLRVPLATSGRAGRASGVLSTRLLGAYRPKGNDPRGSRWP